MAAFGAGNYKSSWQHSKITALHCFFGSYYQQMMLDWLLFSCIKAFIHGSLYSSGGKVHLSKRASAPLSVPVSYKKVGISSRNFDTAPADAGDGPTHSPIGNIATPPAVHSFRHPWRHLQCHPHSRHLRHRGTSGLSAHAPVCPYALVCVPASWCGFR